MQLSSASEHHETVSSGASAPPLSSLLKQYRDVRAQTLALVEPLSNEDMVAQSMPDASPAKWHLAHTTWFFETFILSEFSAEFRWFDQDFCHLFNSYYESVGSRHARPQRGLLTRPPLSKVLRYREHVDQLMGQLLQGQLLQGQLLEECPEEQQARIRFLVTVGLHHEMQHQELISTDILHLFWQNPTMPAVYNAPYQANSAANTSAPSSVQNNHCVTEFSGGLVSVGCDAVSAQQAQTFSYDCETPCHQVFLQPFALHNQLVSNAQWLEFMLDGGYQNSLLWLSDGWHWAQKNGWQGPLYWLEQEGSYYQFGLHGLLPLNLNAPVCHVSFYEADAFARWAGKRLPKEHEWEWAAKEHSIAGNFLEQGEFRPVELAEPSQAGGLSQLYGDVWEWTQSPFGPYPSFKAEQGALGEYNGKFMNGQYVLRGGSCVTPRAQMRSTYRNFFYPHHRWQFSGVRLAIDL